MEEKKLTYDKPKKAWKTCLYGSVFIVLCFFLILTIGFNIIYVSAPVDGESMQPTLNETGGSNSDTVYIKKFEEYSVGDIIVIKKDTIDDQYIIKRVIAKEGDSICIYYDEDSTSATYGQYVLERSDAENSQSHIVQEDYIKSVSDMATTYDNLYNPTTGLISSEEWDSCFSECDGKSYFTVPMGTVFVLGDNRGNSLDSSILGPYSINNVVGKVYFIVKYGENKIGFFFKVCFGIEDEI